MGYVIGLDLGTSALKGIVADSKGKVISTAVASYPLLNEKSGYSEQHPQDWRKAVDNVLLKLNDQVPDLASKLDGMSISGQMHGLVVLDENGEVLRPAILWNDTRTTEICTILNETLGEELIDWTKNKALEGFTLPKVIWMQQYEPELWQKVHKMMLPKDYIIYYLTGIYATDRSDAAGTLMFDVVQGTWSENVLQKFNIKSTLLPTVYDSQEVVGVIQSSVADRLGYQQEVLVAAGGADNACAAIGAGIIYDDVAMVSIGTSGVFLSYESDSRVHYNGELHVFNHAQPNAFYAMGVTLSAGHSLKWFKETFANEQTFESLLEGIEHIHLGSDGLLYTPYIVGERTPYADSQIRGSFIGIDSTHTLKHFVRAVVEGITFSLKDLQKLMKTVTQKSIKRIVSVGGGAKNRVWLQIQADIFNTEIVTLQTEQGPGMGAAMLAMVACGWYEDLEQCVKTCVNYQDIIQPQSDRVKQYEKYYQSYCKIYEATKEICHQYKK